MLRHSAPGQWDPARLLPLVRSIARGMHHLHARGIAHRDLKPANIFVGQGQTMKIGDFGMSRYVPVPGSNGGGGAGAGGAAALRRLSPGVVGTPQYAAPELFNESLRPPGEPGCAPECHGWRRAVVCLLRARSHRPCRRPPDCAPSLLAATAGGGGDLSWALKLDVWSFGVTLWEVMERRRPFEGVSELGVMAQWLNAPYEARLPPVRVPESLDPGGKRVLRGLADLVEDCTRLDPGARPAFGEILRRLRGLTPPPGGGGGLGMGE
jgi:serine/threonine protein kinase